MERGQEKDQEGGTPHPPSDLPMYVAINDECKQDSTGGLIDS